MPASQNPQPEELFSAAFDSGNSHSEERYGVSAERTAQLTAEWQRLGDSLRRLPVEPAEGLASAVMAEIEDAPVVTVGNVESNQSPERSRRLLAITVSAAAVLLTGVFLSTYVNNDGEPSPFVTSTSASAKPNWDVIVVTLNHDEAEAAEYVRSSVADRGLKIQTLTDEPISNEHPDLLMASGDNSDVLRSIFSESDIHFDAVVNPDSIDGLDRDQLIEQIEASVNIPTKSDERFGEMLVALPADGKIVRRRLPNRENETEVASTESDQADVVSVATSDGSESVSDYLSRGRAKPVLVVLRRTRKVESPDHQGNREEPGRIRPPV